MDLNVGITLQGAVSTFLGVPVTLQGLPLTRCLAFCGLFCGLGTWQGAGFWHHTWCSLRRSQTGSPARCNLRVPCKDPRVQCTFGETYSFKSLASPAGVRLCCGKVCRAGAAGPAVVRQALAFGDGLHGHLALFPPTGLGHVGFVVIWRCVRACGCFVAHLGLLRGACCSTGGKRSPQVSPAGSPHRLSPCSTSDTHHCPEDRSGKAVGPKNRFCYNCSQ